MLDNVLEYLLKTFVFHSFIEDADTKTDQLLLNKLIIVDYTFFVSFWSSVMKE